MEALLEQARGAALPECLKALKDAKDAFDTAAKAGRVVVCGSDWCFLDPIPEDVGAGGFPEVEGAMS